MANLLYESIHYVMWVGLALCCILLFPYPRCLRRPLVSGLERFLTSTVMKHVQCYFLIFVAMVYVNSLYQMKQHTIQLIQHKAEKQAAAMGSSLMELEKTINQTRMHLFLDQRNAQMTFFVLVLFFIIFTYLYSLKRDDELHATLLGLQEKMSKEDKETVPISPNNTPIELNKQSENNKDSEEVGKLKQE